MSTAVANIKYNYTSLNFFSLPGVSVGISYYIRVAGEAPDPLSGLGSKMVSVAAWREREPEQ